MLYFEGFNLIKWMSSSRNILAELCPLGLACPAVNHDFDELPIERTVGILWDSQHDTNFSKFNIINTFEPNITKYKFLIIIARIFDPLVLVIPVVFKMKILMPETWKLPSRLGRRITVISDWKTTRLVPQFKTFRKLKNSAVLSTTTCTTDWSTVACLHRW